MMHFHGTQQMMVKINRTGEIFSVNVTKKKPNGIYGIPVGDGWDEEFFQYDDIQILEIDKCVNEMPVEV